MRLAFAESGKAPRSNAVLNNRKNTFILPPVNRRYDLFFAADIQKHFLHSGAEKHVGETNLFFPRKTDEITTFLKRVKKIDVPLGIFRCDEGKVLGVALKPY